MAVIEPPPVISPIAESRRELMQSDWQKYFLNANTVLQATPIVFNVDVDLNDQQNTSIGTTNIPLPSLAQGMYIFQYYARVTLPAGVASSLTVTLGWTEGAVSLSVSGPAMTGNSVTTVQTASVPVFIDAATPLTYATAYVSNPALAMRYTLKIKVQNLQGGST